MGCLFYLPPHTHIYIKKDNRCTTERQKKKKKNMLDQKPIYKINEYHIKVAWEKKNNNKIQVNEK